jgi:hypothetical protein
MALAIEIMGMTLLGSSLNPAESKVEQLECLTADGAINHPPIQQPDKKTGHIKSCAGYWRWAAAWGRLLGRKG